MKETIDFLENLYRYLYKQNCVAAEEDYLEYFESEFALDKMLGHCMTADDLITALRSLVAELVDDTGDEALIKEWAVEGGANDELLKKLNLV